MNSKMNFIFEMNSQIGTNYYLLFDEKRFIIGVKKEDGL